jgi:predicted nuclease with RNAse H fold
MPCNYIVRAVVLLKLTVRSVELRHDSPLCVKVLVDVRDWVQKVPRVCKPVAADRPKIRQFPSTTPNLRYIAARCCSISGKPDGETDTTRDNANFACGEEQAAHLGLDVNVAELSCNQHVSIAIAVCSILHALVDHEDMLSYAFAQVRIAAAQQCVETVDEVDFLVLRRQWKWSKLGDSCHCLDIRIDRKECILHMGCRLRVGLELICKILPT